MKRKNEDEGKKGIVESFLGGIPLFGDFLKELGKTETFKERFKEINERIEENLSRGDKRYVSVEGNISVRPLSIRPSSQRILSELKKDTSELSIQKDYVYWKEGKKLMLAVKAPNEDVDVSLTGRNVLLKGDNFNKKIALPAYYKSIEKKHYKKGILILELTK